MGLSTAKFERYETLYERAALFRYATMVDTFVEKKRKVHLLIRVAYPSINIFPVGER